METRKRYNTIDVMRILAIILVVYQHACGDTALELLVQSTAKIGVPLFLIISGFFYRDTVKGNKEIKQIKKMLFYAIGTFVVYFAVELLLSIRKGTAIAYLLQYIKIGNIVKFLVFNDPIAADFSWYLWAVLYVLVICYFINKYGKMDVLVKLIPVFFLLVMFLGKLSGLLFGEELEYFYCRNFFSTGFLYFSLGYFLRKKAPDIEHVSNKKWGLLCVAFLILGCVEYFILVNFDLNGPGFYITTTFLSICTFCYFYTLQLKGEKINKLAMFARKYVLPIYVTHSMIVKVEKKIFSMDNGFGWIGFIFVLVCSFVLCWLYFKLKTFIVNRKAASL